MGFGFQVLVSSLQSVFSDLQDCEGCMPYDLRVVLVGLAAGYLSGQFGVGGGIVTTPGIRILLGRSELISLGTPLLAIIPTVASGAYVYSKKGLIDNELIFPLVVSGIIGIVFGSLATVLVSAHLLMLLTAFIILILGLRFMAVQIEGVEQHIQQITFGNPVERRNASFLIGLGCGFFSGFLGLGGGILLVPSLNLLLRQNLKKAFGTSLIVIAFYAVPGSIIHLFLGHIDLKLAMLLILGTIPGAYVGAKTTVHLSESFLKSLFGLFLIAMAVYFIYFEIISIMLKIAI